MFLCVSNCTALIGKWGNGRINVIYKRPGSLDMKSNAHFDIGQGSNFEIDEKCSLIMDKVALVRPNLTKSALGLQLYCNSDWEIGQSAWISLQNNATIQINQSAVMDDGTFVYMCENTQLLVNNHFELSGSAFLAIRSGSKIYLHPTGSETIISGSSGESAKVLLETQSTLLSMGILHLGEGSAVNITIGYNSKVTVEAQSQLSVRESSTLLLREQCDLCVSGDSFVLQAKSKHIMDAYSTMRVSAGGSYTSGENSDGGFLSGGMKSSVFISGTVTNLGSIFVGQLGKVSVSGQLELEASLSIILLTNASISVEVGSNLIFGSGSLKIGENSSLTVGYGKFCEVLTDFSISNNRHLQITDIYPPRVQCY